MTDRELLEAAARAAGIDEVWRFPFGKNGDIYIPHAGLWAHRDTSDDEGALRIWNPLTDDGDALRLAVTCSINFHEQWRWNGHSSYAAYRVLAGHLLDATDTGFPAPTRRQHTWCGEEYEPHDGDKLQATRRAITRAAAEIGRAS